MDRHQLGSYCIAGVSTLVALLLVYGVPPHITADSWPVHAQNHIFPSLFWIVGFCLLNALVALRPLRAGRAWARWAVVGSGGFIFLGYFIPILVTGGGAPGPLDDVVFGTLAGVYALGVAMMVSEE